MTIYIKNMVSTLCKVVVKNELERLGYRCVSVNLGEATLEQKVTEVQLAQINVALQHYGLALIADPKHTLIERIKTLVIKLVHDFDEELVFNLSDYISTELNHNYNYLSNLFSKMHGMTIEKYVILNKIERVKEFIIYDEMNLSEIAYKMQYSSLAHLSNQFKKVTGISPTEFKKQKDNYKSLRALDSL